MAYAGLTNPPDGLACSADAGAGVWGTDVDYYVSDGSFEFLTGDGGIVFKDTEPSGTGWIQCYTSNDKLVPVTEGELYRVGVWLRANDADADQHVYVTINWYDESKAYDSNTSILAAAVDAAATWQYVTQIVTVPAGVHYMGRVFGKRYDSAVAYTAYFDTFEADKVEPAFSAYLSTPTSYTTGSTIICDTEDYDHGGVYDHTTGIFTAPSDGLYAFAATVQIIDLNAGNLGAIRLHRNGGAWIYGTHGFAHANGDDPIFLSSSPAALLNAGDTVKAVVVHNYGSARNAGGAASLKYTHFEGAKIR
jgi:C1q domain